MNFVYDNIERESYDKIKPILTKNIGEPVFQKVEHCIEALKFSNSQCSLILRYYKSKKLMFQGNLKDFDGIINEIEKIIGLLQMKKRIKI